MDQPSARRPRGPAPRLPPLVLPALGFLAGVALAPSLPAPWAPGGWLVWVATLASAGGLLAGERPRAAATCLAIAALGLGVVRGAPPPLPHDHVAQLDLPRESTVVGRVAGAPRRHGNGVLRLHLAVESVDDVARSGTVALAVRGEPLPALAPGQRVAATLRLHRAIGHRNPGGHDHGAQLRRAGIHVVASARAGRVIELEPARPPWHTRLRAGLGERLTRALPPVSAALLAGLLVGDRSGLPEDVEARFRRAGVAHVLAVSGFNVAVVGGAVLWGLGRSGLGRAVATVAALAAVIGFAFVAGPEPSVLRAALMGAVGLCAVLLERPRHALNALALAAALLVAYRPVSLEEPGFQLSAAATLGLILAPHAGSVLARAAVASLAAALAVLPVALTQFHAVSLVGPAANLAVVPLAAAATVLGLAGAGVGLASVTLAQPLLDAAWPLLLLLRAVAAAGAAVPGALVELPAPSLPASAAYAGGLLVLRLAWQVRDERGRSRRLALAGASGLALAGALAAWPFLRPPDGSVRVTVLDVGQGEAIVVETPSGRTLLVDAGPAAAGASDAGTRVVAPYLWHRGVWRLALAITTHADSDHAGGMGTVRRLFRPRAEWTADDAAAGRGYIDGALTLTALPAPPDPRASRNERGLVLRLDHGAFSLLLAGDAGAQTEERLLANRASVRAVVLKVGHHGARGGTGAEFLAAVAPRVGVISVGPRNPYGHPAPETLARLEAAGARVWRTDRDGAIVLVSDGRRLTVTAWATGARDDYCLDPAGGC